MTWRRVRASVLATSLVAGGLVIASPGANVGDIAQGAVMREDATVLVLDSDPCDPDSAKITFASPWKKHSVGKKTCPDKSSHEIFQVEQLKAPAGDNGTNNGDRTDGNRKDKNGAEKSPKKPEQKQPPENDRQQLNRREER